MEWVRHVACTVPTEPDDDDVIDPTVLFCATTSADLSTAVGEFFHKVREVLVDVPEWKYLEVSYQNVTGALVAIPFGADGYPIRDAARVRLEARVIRASFEAAYQGPSQAFGPTVAADTERLIVALRRAAEAEGVLAGREPSALRLTGA